MSDPAGYLPRRTVPLRRRSLDWVLLAFFAVNPCFITYFIDIEQLTVANAYHFHYPAWPPPAIARMSRAHPFTESAPLPAAAPDPVGGAAGLAEA